MDDNKTANRTDKGTFVKGVSGNPSGRPKVIKQIQEMARQYGPEAIAVLVDAMRTAKDVKVRCAAACAILDRGYGKPINTLQRTDWDMAPAALAEASTIAEENGTSPAIDGH